jgi:phosphoenolpyruvate synthase/pyruvate phosphate dikinase
MAVKKGRDPSGPEVRHLRRARRRSGQRQVLRKVGLNYVSCSPYRVPIARLAAAQAAGSGARW